MEMGDKSDIEEANETEAQKEATLAKELKETLIHGCEHYRRRCQLVCPDEGCGKIYTCRFCHDENESSHTLDRYNVKKVVCLLCSEQQEVSNKCTKCSTPFGKYHCPICNLFNDEERGQFHCDACGLCRVGPQEKFFHCAKCNICVPIKLRGNHKCIENSSKSPCSVCLEDIHTSRLSSHIPICGHLIHNPCFEQLMKRGIYQCPLCNSSMLNMTTVWTYFDEKIEQNPINENLKDVLVEVLCRDCHLISVVNYHYVGLKCQRCGSFNTSRESAYFKASDTLPENSSQGPEAPGTNGQQN